MILSPSSLCWSFYSPWIILFFWDSDEDGKKLSYFNLSPRWPGSLFHLEEKWAWSEHWPFLIWHFGDLHVIIHYLLHTISSQSSTRHPLVGGKLWKWGWRRGELSCATAGYCRPSGSKGSHEWSILKYIKNIYIDQHILL